MRRPFALFHRWRRVVALLAVLAGCGGGPTDTDGPPTLALVNGRWFDGTGFVPRTLYAKGGFFTEVEPREVTRTVDLDGMYVMPPLAESHTHTLFDEPRIGEFLDRGIFYARVMNTGVRTAAARSGEFNQPTSVDVRVTVAGLTASNGHPVQIGLAFHPTLEALDGDWLHLVDDLADLDAKWDQVVAVNPDFIKVFLIYSDEYAVRATDPTVPTRLRGLDPALLPEIVARGAAANLPVAAHVRTAADFRTALAAGVREIAHVPGFSLGPRSVEEVDDPWFFGELAAADRFRLTMEDAQTAASVGAVVHTTVLGVTEVPPDVPPELRDLAQQLIDLVRDVQRANLTLLRDEGVTVVTGSDAGDDDVVDELLYLATLGVFTPPDLLTMATVTTPQWMFPGRFIGVLGQGYEASLVAYRSNPLEDLGVLSQPAVRIKQGWVLN